MKHQTNGQIDVLSYSYQIGLLKTHKERLDYLSDVDKKWHDLVYLTAMQMNIPKTISRLGSREKRKEAWSELPAHSRALEGMKNMVYHKVVTIFKKGETDAQR